MSSVFAVTVNKQPIAIFTTREKAEKFLNLAKLDETKFGYQYKVKEIYTDCYINKLENGYKVYKVFLSKSGKLLEEIEQVTMFPKMFGGYRTASIVPFHKGALTRFGEGMTSGIAFIYQNLHSSPNEALQEAQRERQKTLLDDYWQTACKKWNMKEFP